MRFPWAGMWRMEMSKSDRGGKAREVGGKPGALAEEGTKRVSKRKMWPIVLTADEGSSKLRIRNCHWTWQCGRNHCLEIVSMEKPIWVGWRKNVLLLREEDKWGCSWREVWEEGMGGYHNLNVGLGLGVGQTEPNIIKCDQPYGLQPQMMQPYCLRLSFASVLGIIIITSIWGNFSTWIQMLICSTFPGGQLLPWLGFIWGNWTVT